MSKTNQYFLSFLDKMFNFLGRFISPGLMLSGNLKISSAVLQADVRIDQLGGITWAVEWPVLNMSKEMLLIRRNKEEMVDLFFLFLTLMKVSYSLSKTFDIDSFLHYTLYNTVDSLSISNAQGTKEFV